MDNRIFYKYTDAFEKDLFVKGKMSAKLKVKSDCEDTCFYVRVSIEKEQGDSFLVKKGDRLRIDISSADNEHYVCYTNNKGLYSEQIIAKIAHNSVLLQESYLVLPIEE